MPTPIESWTVDYGTGPKPIRTPHAWNQDVAADWEGPATYRTTLTVPAGPSWLVFHGVSYEALVFLDGHLACEHRGMWDAFSVDLRPFANRTISLEVRVTKSGGAKFPVRRIAGGFLPFVFQTFGGIYREVEVVEGAQDPVAPRPVATPRTSVHGTAIHLDTEPYYLRGLLHWGWYPDLGHPNPDERTIRHEVRKAKELGFNCVKFCLWVPPHRYLDVLGEEGMLGWLELPLWDPSPDEADQRQMYAELERIVLQYRHHPEIAIWTCGCELSSTLSAEMRQALYQMVKSHTGSPLVKDNSGGSEMYGGDPREFGDFYDFHPYCDAEFFPAVLESLGPGPRKPMPTLLGEYNDYDVLRDLRRLAADGVPYWASPDPYLNPQGVRWQHDLPKLVAEAATQVDRPDLREASRKKALWIRKFVTEEARARPGFAGYVLTGWRDTPISSSGMFDDWGASRFTSEEMSTWNGPRSLFLIPRRRPPWVHGGNRPGWIDRFNYFPGAVLLQVGLHSESDVSGALEWWIVGEATGQVASGRGAEVQVNALVPTEVGQVFWRAHEPGEYWLEVAFAGATNRWPLWIVPPSDLGDTSWGKDDALGLLPDLELSGGPNRIVTGWEPGRVPARGVALLTGHGTSPAPFWRECAFEFGDAAESAFAEEFANRWERLWPVSTDRCLDLDVLEELGKGWEPLMMRIDTRTMRRSPIVARLRRKRGTLLATTLRPFGGLGSAPTSLTDNPAGQRLLAVLMQDATRE